MNKEELLNLVESLNMPRDEYYILGGGSLVMFGILHDTNTKMAENMIESANILDFDKMIKKA